MTRIWSVLFAMLFGYGIATAGETIRVIVAQNTWTDAVKEHIPEFERATGIKVQLESFEEEQLGRKLTAEMSAGTDLDVFVTRPLNDGRLFAANGWYADLTPRLADDPDFDFQDFSEGSRSITRINGVQICIPTSDESHVIFYRKDIFAAHGLQPPQTFSELLDVAKTLTDREKGFYGILMRGRPSPLITQFSSFLYSCGGDWFDPRTRRATFASPEALAAIDIYGTLLREYGPPDAPNMGWPQMMALYQQGRGAMYIDASAHYPMLVDPTKSDLADKTGVYPFPAGPAGSRPYGVTAMGMAIFSGSLRKDTAWQFIRYMTDKSRITAIQGTYSYPGARRSAFESAEGIRGFPEDLLTTLAQTTANAIDYDRPLVMSVAEAREILGEAVVTSIRGGDYRAAARLANQRFQGILDQEK